MANNKNLKFSVLIPVYNMAGTIGDTLRSILGQSYSNFEIVIQDNSSSDGTERVIKSFKDSRIAYHKNGSNIGAPQNMVEGEKNCSGDIVYMMAADDILEKNALLKTYKAFKISDEIGAVTRPYFWFDKSINSPVRAKKQLSSKKDTVIDINMNNDAILNDFLSTLDQLSGLAYRKKYMRKTFRNDIWTCHGSVLLNIWKEHPVVCLSDYVVAVRIGHSATRSNIYTHSPMLSWIHMFNDVFSGAKFIDIRRKCVHNFVATNYVGLVQIRNFGTMRSFLREVLLLVKYRPINLLSPIFWFFVFFCIVTPPILLIPLVDFFKSSVYSRSIKSIGFNLWA